MKISMVMAACNAGPLLHETVEAARDNLQKMDFEIIVVDDQSTDEQCDSLRKDVTLLRTSKRLGCSGSRQHGCLAATGDVIILTDPHCYYAPGTLQELGEKAIEKISIVQPWICVEKAHRICPYNVQIRPTKRGLQIQRYKRRKAGCTSLGGSIYAFTQETFSKLIKMPPLPFHWGAYELFWTLVCYRVGVPILRLDTKEPSLHRQYRGMRTLPYSLKPACARDMNEQWAISVCLPRYYELLFKRICTRHRPDIDMTPVLKGEHYDNMKKWVQEQAVTTEEWCLENACRVHGLLNNGTVLRLLGQ